jgi:hypothetical protein
VSAQEQPARVAGEVLGFRQWRVDDDLRLTSASNRGRWEPGVNDARCVPGPVGMDAPGHAAPHHACECGLDALHAPTFWYGQDARDDGSLASAMRRMSNAVSGLAGDREYVAGLVVAWGRLEVHRDGFRAEHARVAAIAVPEGRKLALVARAVAHEYGVPAVPQAELERVAPEFGATVPKDLRPASRPEPGLFFTTSRGLPPSRHAAAEDAVLKMIRAQVDAQMILGSAARSTPARPTFGARHALRPSSPRAPKPGPAPAPRRAVPAPVARARAARPKYDPLASVPKRKGGHR